MSNLFRLHPHLQHAIIHDLGWRSLRDVQEQTIDAVFDGCNALVLAPTAGGKTEAAMFPVLSRILQDRTEPVSTPSMLRVQHVKDEVGYVDTRFIQGHDERDAPMLFRLAGRAWEIVTIDWKRSIVSVRPADQGALPQWLGLPVMLSFEICQEIRRTLIEPGPETGWLTRAAASELALIRESYEGLFEGDETPLEDQEDGVQWHTFAGGAINRLLAAALKRATGHAWRAGNLSLRCSEIGLVEARRAIRDLEHAEWEPLAVDAARAMARGRISKFQPCLPDEMEAALLIEKLLDIAATERFVRTARVSVVAHDHAEKDS